MSTNRDDFGIAIRSALLQRGAGQKFSLIVFICLSILIFFLDSFPSRTMDISRSVINDSIYRVSTMSSSPFKFINLLKDKTVIHFNVRKENIELKNELEILRNKDFNLEFLASENKRLKEKLVSSEEKKYNYVIAKVIIDKNSPFLKSVILNRGTKSGSKKGMPVLDGNYLVGRIVETNYLSSRVLLLNDLNSRIPVTFGDRAVQAIMTGDGRDKPRLEYLPENFEPLDGETVFTSGKDGIFSPGIPVGKTLFEKKNIKVQLFSDPNQLSYLNIILTDLSKKEIF